MKRRILPLITAAAVITLSMATIFTSVAASQIQASLTSFNANTADSANCINPKFKVTNTSNDNISLKDVTIRYYFDSDSIDNQQFACDYAAISGTGYKAITNIVKGNFADAVATDQADKYLEISFKDDATVIPTNSFAEIQARIYNSNWQPCKQTNDYSFNGAAKDYVSNDKICLFIGGKLISGVPVGREGDLADSEILVNSADFTLNKSEDVLIPIKFNNNSVLSVVNGKTALNNTDYSVSEDGLIIKADYLNTLVDGLYTFTTSFDYGNDASFTVKVIDADKPIVYDPLIKANATVNGSKVDISVDLSHASDPINNYNMTIKFDNTKLKATSVAAGSTVTNPEGFAYKIDNNNGTIKVLFIDMSQTGGNAIKADGTLFNIAFESIDKTASSVTINDLCICNNNLEEIKTDTQDVSVELL